MENNVLATVEGVEGVGTVNVTEKMARVYAKRYNVPYVEDNVPGVLASLIGFVNGGAGGVHLGNMSCDSFLFHSPETRDLFKPVREAFDIRTTGKVLPEDQFSKVSITEVIPDWDTFKQTLE